jgi:acetyltransferase-like isoleucine patch superfamily enzyme
MRLRLKIHQESHVSLNGSLLAEDWGNESGRASLTVAQGAKLELKGDFAIGPEVHISVSRNAELVLGGRNLSSGSGITCRSRVMVEKKIHIGADSIIAWNVFISDSDWHDIEGQPRAIPVWIGNHVWVSHDVSVLKGAVVPNDCIIGAKSLVIQKEFPESCLIAGVPATVRRIGVKWQR